ncbi:4Fe-4S dicluster domain-containing protein [Clostridium sp. SHJSY1]|uniref:4Fe-4S dicluster domain-containing protein n=1 Tax=Clostridium sp. SHJSY1 TaxID=2942483 RepID=UPI0028767F0F|nr:4Fe-4S dicluster domain-containing protein [Clostridium sp. SHJSY1]MDS0525857.1 4Fe-4S dicluster domain-containing protein [Clostridium sp. SHJSY1]
MKTDCNLFVLGDASKCVGCKACEMACFKAHNKVVTVGNIRRSVVSRIHVVKNGAYSVPVQCRHCEDAPCAKVCPKGAIKSEDNGIMIDEKICIGCKECVLACPFGAIEIGMKYDYENESIDEKEKMVAYKCDLCREHDEPACIKVCPKDALKLFNVEEEKRLRNIRAVSNLNL